MPLLYSGVQQETLANHRAFQRNSVPTGCLYKWRRTCTFLLNHAKTDINTGKSCNKSCYSSIANICLQWKASWERVMWLKESDNKWNKTFVVTGVSAMEKTLQLHCHEVGFRASCSEMQVSCFRSSACACLVRHVVGKPWRSDTR